ncbi:MAG: hypothetical protein V3U14_12785 [candidate division NC10 bacterium]
MSSIPDDKHPNTKFNEAARKRYLDSLRGGTLKIDSAKKAGVSYKTVIRRRDADTEFRELEELALMEAREIIESVIFELGRAGDLKAGLAYLAAHDRSTWGNKTTIEVDATPAAVEMSQNDALARIAELKGIAEGRRLALEEDDTIIDAVIIEDNPNPEVPAQVENLKELQNPGPRSEEPPATEVP